MKKAKGEKKKKISIVKVCALARKVLHLQPIRM